MAILVAGCGGTVASGKDAGDSGTRSTFDASSDVTVSDGSRTDSASDANIVVDAGFDAPRDAPLDNDPRCPSTYGATGACSPQGLMCLYVQGRCDCVQPCSGVAIGDASAWDCVPNTGCPIDQPEAGAACATAGAHCVYPGCCTVDDFTCDNGAWDAAPPFCPP